MVIGLYASQPEWIRQVTPIWPHQIACVHCALSALDPCCNVCWELQTWAMITMLALGCCKANVPNCAYLLYHGTFLYPSTKMLFNDWINECIVQPDIATVPQYCTNVLSHRTTVPSHCTVPPYHRNRTIVPYHRTTVPYQRTVPSEACTILSYHRTVPPYRTSRGRHSFMQVTAFLNLHNL